MAGIHEREKLPIGEFGTKPRSLEHVTAFLQGKSFDPSAQYFEFQIAVSRHPVSASDIRKLLDFPFEFMIISNREGLRIETGTENNVSSSGEYLGKARGLRLFMHTHPNGLVPVTTPSFADVIISDAPDRKTQQLLVHAEGIMIYQAPVFNPFRNELFRGDIRDLMVYFGEANGVDIFSNDFQDLTPAEKVRLQRKFVEETKMIVREAGWDTVERLQEIIKVINLQRRIFSDNQPAPSVLDSIDLSRYGYSRRGFLSNFGHQIDLVKYPSGRLGHDENMRRSWIAFITKNITEELNRKGVSGTYKEHLQALSEEASALKIELH